MARSQGKQLVCVALVLVRALGLTQAQEEEMSSVNETAMAYPAILYQPDSTWDVPDKTLLTLDTHELLGVWKAEGAQVPRAAFELEDALPDCSAFPDQFDYRHNINDDQYQIFALDSAVPDQHYQIVIGHRESYSSNITNYSDNVLTLDYQGEEYNQTFYTYLDRNTGLVKARVVYNTIYSQGEGGNITYTDAPVPASGTPDTPGCFTINSTAVRVAQVFTYVCQQGECGAYSPLFTQYDVSEPFDACAEE